jgi:hypothetical protein
LIYFCTHDIVKVVISHENIFVPLHIINHAPYPVHGELFRISNLELLPFSKIFSCSGRVGSSVIILCQQGRGLLKQIKIMAGDIEDMHQKGYKAQRDCTWKGA